MRGVRNPELEKECIRLRVQERLSYREIHERTGASRGSLSKWLRKYPLTEEEKKQKASKQKRWEQPKKDRGVESDLHRMLKSRPLSRHRKAKIAEAIVLLRLIVHRFDPFGSVFDGDKADWMALDPKTGKAHKIQVRWVKEGSHGLPIVSLRCTEGHNRSRSFREGDFDFIVGYDLFTDTCYVWSWDDVKHLNTSVSICPEAEERWDKLRR